MPGICRPIANRRIASDFPCQRHPACGACSPARVRQACARRADPGSVACTQRRPNRDPGDRNIAAARLFDARAFEYFLTRHGSACGADPRHGIEASVYNHTVEDAVVSNIVQKYRAGDRGPYILVGHSLGADAVMVMAQQLNANGVPVALVVPFDGTGSYAPKERGLRSQSDPAAIRLYAARRGLPGKLQNVDVSADTSIDHFTIDKSPRLQAMALSSVLQAAHAETCRPGGTGPAVARPKDAPLPKETDTPREMPSRSASPVLRPGDQGQG